MARWAMVHEASTFVANVIEWDGNTANWQPPAGYKMVEDKDSKASSGGTWTEAGGFLPPPSAAEAGPVGGSIPTVKQ